MKRLLPTPAFLLLLACVVVSSLIGCGDGRPDRVPVSGRVMIDGQPLVAATNGYTHVMLVPTDARPAYGKIDSEGRFTLATYSDEGEDGCVPGEHTVVVTAYEQVGASACRWLVPPKYRDYRTSDKKVTIDGPTDDLQIDLSWDGGKPYVQRFDTTGDADPTAVN